MYSLPPRRASTPASPWSSHRLSSISLSHFICVRSPDLVQSPFSTPPTLLPYDILFCPPSPITSGGIVSLATARKSGLLTKQDAALVDLRIGVLWAAA
ncbi:hypothetical protein HYPSUDRAFT_209988 [Hypholoma sublateritium FD-334 SS-4]|uniref:Uncharacterized protein n=1 Tax=Hypholoma sublateritium (strain FD-334 SS-4) TaxID=945553 RepID=A0A0D2N154_HYPSF|nr:hypothetical protein HYPSUDRAFT_209988 [Hypholoma sublateritium FD-334 SS-4]